MKKLLVLVLAMMLLVGCSQQKKDTTFMVTRDNPLYALYNQNGERLTEYSYKTFEEVSGIGYIVTDANDQKGVISDKGDEIIKPGTYETLEAVDEMLYATKKVEVKKEKKDDKDKKEEKQTTPTQTFIKNNLYVLNNKGEVLYSADEKTGIMKSGLPIILKDNTYIVLYHNGEILYNDIQIVRYANQYKNSTSVILGLEKNENYYYFDKQDEKNNIELTINEKGTFQFLAQNDKGVVLNDEATKSMIYIDFEHKKYYQNTIAIKEASFDSTGNIVLTNDNKTFVYEVGKAPVLMTSYYMSAYTYVARSTDIYGPHHIFKDGKSTGDFENCQLYPVAYHVYYEIFPVYIRDKGYQYYNFDNKKVIDKTFLAAEPFDANGRAIVKSKEEGYSLIDETGKVLTKDVYNQIKYIGSSYYAVYNENGTFGILDKDAGEIFPMEYTSLPTEAIVNYDSHDYLILGKNGRSFVYDIEDEMKEIFSHEGSVTLSEKGYFKVDNQYFTFEGEEIK